METLSSESFIQKHLQTYLWSWKHTEDRLYLLKVMLINFLTLQTTKLLKCNFFPRNTTVFRNVVVELFMSDVDGYAKTIANLAYASKRIQC